jgi:hypothetical protein
LNHADAGLNHADAELNHADAGLNHAHLFRWGLYTSTVQCADGGD